MCRDLDWNTVLLIDRLESIRKMLLNVGPEEFYLLKDEGATDYEILKRLVEMALPSHPIQKRDDASKSLITITHYCEPNCKIYKHNDFTIYNPLKVSEEWKKWFVQNYINIEREIN